ncbi:hypothetical protein N665_0264s0022 [Sinapis alba]|nr:hypothetical protein N665_0264s0022 [Sinapis alba]
MDFIGLFGAFLASFCFLIVYNFLNKKTFGYLRIKKTLQSYPWNWPILGMFPGLLMRINRINDSVEVLENSNMTGFYSNGHLLLVGLMGLIRPITVNNKKAFNPIPETERHRKSQRK